MFQKLYTRYMRFLWPCVVMIFSLYGLVSFFAFQYLLNDDYNGKIRYFTELQARSGSDYLRLAEHNMDLFLIQNVPQNERYDTYKACRNLQKIRSISLDIYSVFFMDHESLYYMRQATDRQFLLTRQQMEPYVVPDGSFRWLYLSSGHIETDMLLCVKSVPYGQDKVFTLGILLPADSILPKAVHAEGGAGIFSQRSFFSTLLYDSDSVIYLNDSAAEVPVDDPAPKWAVDVLEQKIDSSPFTLRLTVLKSTLLMNYGYFFFGILLICVFLAILARWMLRRFLNRLTGALDSFCYRFSNCSIPDAAQGEEPPTDGKTIG